jgi:hypothetical protein
MTVHYFMKEREDARLAHAAGLEYASPSVIDIGKIMEAGGWAGPDYHDWYGHYCSGETVSDGTPRTS